MAMPPKGDVPKAELARSIVEMLDMNDLFVEGLSKANRSSIIALRNCVLAKVEKIEELEAEIAELEAEIIDLKA